MIARRPVVPGPSAIFVYVEVFRVVDVFICAVLYSVEYLTGLVFLTYRVERTDRVAYSGF
jgi:hypothetical protein